MTMELQDQKYYFQYFKLVLAQHQPPFNLSLKLLREVLSLDL